MRHMILAGIMTILLFLILSNKVFALDATAVVINHQGSSNRGIDLDIEGMTKVPIGLFNVNVIKYSGFRGIMYKKLNCKASYINPLQVNSRASTLIINYDKSKIALGLYNNTIAIPQNKVKVVIDEKDTLDGKWNNLDCFMQQ